MLQQKVDARCKVEQERVVEAGKQDQAAEKRLKFIPRRLCRSRSG